MFVISVKPTIKKIFLALLSVFIVVFSITLLLDRSNTLAANKTMSQTKLVTTNAQRVAFLGQFGWEVSDEAVQIVDIRIPAEFSDVYEKYNKIQKKQGFDLKKYKEKTVRRYTYEVKNYKDEPDFINANLLIYNDKIIGGDICSVKLDGFMHGLNENSDSK